MRQTYSKEELPIVILSALNANDDINKALALGANEFLTKPVIMEKFHNCIINIVNNLQH